MAERLRRAGATWRVLVHHHENDSVWSDHAYHVQSDRIDRGPEDDSESSTTTVLPRTEFDELVVGEWIHIEAMDTGVWWMNIAGVVIWVRVGRDGKPKRVDVYGPGAYNPPVGGVEYECDWRDVPEEKT